MAESLNRKIARRYSKAVSNQNFRSDGTLFATATVYDSTTDLPTSNVTRGAQGYVSSNQRLYIRGTGGWYNIATINNTPSINSVQTAGGDSSPFILATDGATTTVITITATDSEGFPITFSAVTDVGFDSIATVSNDSSVFTITPFGADSAGTATSGTLTFKASDGVNIASEVATFTLTFSIVNSKFTELLMKASGNDGVNTSINDDTGEHTITVTGNATTQALTPYHPGGYSTYFDGTADYLQAATSSDFAFGSNNFTIEFWAYPKTISTAALLDPRTTDSQAVPWIGTNSSGYFYYYVSGSNRIVGTNGSVTANEWYHVAVCRSSTTTKMFVNGIQIGSDYSDSTSYVQGGPWRTGTRYNGTTLPYHGYIRDFRCINGTALYTANFAPPTSPLTNTGSETKLLHSHLPYFDDGSSSDHSITISGNTNVERFGPYDYLGYGSTSHGGSVYFDGTGDKLTTPYHADFSFGTGNYTIEAWIYPNALSGNHLIIDTYASGDNGSYQLYWRSTGSSIAFYTVGDNVFLQDPSSTTIVVNNWNHIAVTRSGTTARLFVNGKLVHSATNSRDMTHDNTLCIGAQHTTGTNYFNGYISDVRILKGTALYTSAFTPPTSALTNISGTSILTCNEKPNIYDASKGNRVTLGGTAKSSTAQKKNASSSMLFDGNSDYVELVDNHQYAPGTNKFVVEFWMRYTGGSGTRNVIDTRGQANGYAIRLDSSNNITVYSEPDSATIHTSASSLTQDQWYHVAFVRNNKESYLFIDGAQSGSSAASITSGNPRDFTSKSMVIGAQNDKSQQFFPGYVEDIRIGNNISRYPFIPTAETLTSGSLTKALACYAASETTAVYGASSTSLSVSKNGTPTASDFGPAYGMKSVYFDGNDEWLTINLGSAIGTNDFCVEGWAYRDTSSGNTLSRGIFSISDDTNGWSGSGSNISLQYRNGSNGNEWAAFLNSGQRNITDSDTEVGQWYHFVVQRNGGTSKVFIDGSMIYSIADTFDYSGKQYLAIGTYHSDDDWYGYISNLRVSVGSGSNFYSNSFTPPTSELQA